MAAKIKAVIGLLPVGNRNRLVLATDEFSIFE
jgi:hypothetical protein